MSKVGGGKFAEGAASAGLTQLVMNELKNIKDPALLQWATAIVGAAAAKVVGGKAQTGASVAVSEVRNNLLTHWALEIPGMKDLLAAAGIVIAIDAGVQVLKNEAGEVIATWSAEVGGWVSSTGEWLGNSFSEMKDWAYDIYLSSDIKDVVEKRNPTDNHSTTDGNSLPKKRNLIRQLIYLIQMGVILSHIDISGRM